MKDYIQRTTPVNKNLTKEAQKAAMEIINSDRDELKEIASKGLQHLAMQVGLTAMFQVFEEEVTELCGPKGKHSEDRQAYRHGQDATKVVYGGTKISVKSPRVRSKTGGEIPLDSLEYFQAEDQLNENIFAMILNGISTRKYEGVATRTISAESKSVGKSTVSKRYQVELEKVAKEFFNRKLEDDYFAIMIDGITVAKLTVIVAMGINTDGKKHILGLVAGGSENSSVVKVLLDDLIDRGLNPDTARLFVLDGSKALYKGVKDTFGSNCYIQRCQVHKKRNVVAHLPDSEKDGIGIRISLAYMEYDYDAALSKLNAIANDLEHRYPDAAASLREGLEETLTVHKLNVPGKLRKTLATTNPIESGNSVARAITNRNKRYQSGEMILKHMAAGYIQAEASFKRINGYKEIPFLINQLYVSPEVSTVTA